MTKISNTLRGQKRVERWREDTIAGDESQLISNESFTLMIHLLQPIAGLITGAWTLINSQQGYKILTRDIIPGLFFKHIKSKNIFSNKQHRFSPFKLTE